MLETAPPDRSLDRFLPRSSATEEVFEESLLSSRSHEEQEAAIGPPATRMAPRPLLAPLLAQPAAPAEREAYARLPNQGPMWLRMMMTVKRCLLAPERTALQDGGALLQNGSSNAG